MNFTTLLYGPEVEILGGQCAFGVFVPIVYAEIENDMLCRIRLYHLGGIQHSISKLEQLMGTSPGQNIGPDDASIVGYQHLPANRPPF